MHMSSLCMCIYIYIDLCVFVLYFICFRTLSHAFLQTYQTQQLYACLLFGDLFKDFGMVLGTCVEDFGVGFCDMSEIMFRDLRMFFLKVSGMFLEVKHLIRNL